jgi:hypothetical protein
VVNAAFGFRLFSRPVILSPLLEVFFAGKGQVSTRKEKMNDMRIWSTQFITEFVEIYKPFPCLYNIKSKEYFNKQLKNAAYGKFSHFPLFRFSVFFLLGKAATANPITITSSSFNIFWL